MFAVAAISIAAAAVLQSARPPETARTQTGLFTTLPILWAETGNLADLLASDQETHWARRAIAGGGAIVPLDTLATPAGAPAIANLRHLVLAQPRPLSPDENVVLDDWVRAGGKALLLADPALTEDSTFAVGDRRRPQAVALLSPILGRWGLSLDFDEDQPLGERTVATDFGDLVVNLPGRLREQPGSPCRLLGARLVAICAIGKGRVTIVADAAVLEREDPFGRRERTFANLLDAAFGAP